MKVKHVLPICQILLSFTEGTAWKFSVSFAFCAHFGIIKYGKTDFFLWARADYASFRPECACDCKTIGSHLKCFDLPQDFLAM